MALQKNSTDQNPVPSPLKTLTETADFAQSSGTGIHHLKINAEHKENIPGLSPLWEEEIQLRKNEILAFNQQTFMQRAVSLVKGAAMPPKISGEELMKLHPTKNIQKLVEQLKDNPKNMMIRLELVSLVGKANREFTLETYRALLLQASVACSLGELSIEGLQIALWAQSNYLNKFYSHCRNQLHKIQGYLESTSNRVYGSYKENRLLLMKKGRTIHTNMEVIKTYQKSLSKVAKTTPSTSHLMLDLAQLSETLLNKPKSKEGDRNVKILKSAFLLVQVMRHLPLLHPVAHELSDLLLKLMPEHPLGALLKGRLTITLMTSAINRYESGEQTSEVQKEIQNAFKKGHQYYGVAIKKIGKAKDEMESSILYEYAYTFHYFYKTAKNLLELKLPKEWVKTSFSKADKALSLAIETEQVYQLRKSLYNDMIIEGIIDLS